MNATRAAPIRQRGLPRRLAALSLLGITACSTAPAELVALHGAAPASAAPGSAAPSSASSGESMAVQIDPLSGNFRPLTPGAWLQVARDSGNDPAPPLVVEKDAFGGNMVRLHRRFSGLMQASISQGAVVGECETDGASKAP